jgi:8-oxo-dGTP pyrophosphatase MutT (NUDIX family)
MEDEVRACFPDAAVRTSDDAFIVGQMAAHTRIAGTIQFPSGSIDLRDVVGDRIDFIGAMERELLEETGIEADLLEPEDGWHASLNTAHAPVVKILRSRERADTLRDRILLNLASQPTPEFCQIRVVRTLSDVTPSMPHWMQAFFRYLWA